MMHATKQFLSCLNLPLHVISEPTLLNGVIKLKLNDRLGQTNKKTNVKIKEQK